MQKNYTFTLLNLNDTLRKISNCASFPQNQNVYCNDLAEFPKMLFASGFLNSHFSQPLVLNFNRICVFKKKV